MTLTRFVAIIDNKNHPVFFKSYVPSDDDGIDSQFIAEMALDFVDSHLNKSNSAAKALLLVHDGIAVYGCLTNTNIKVFVGMDASQAESAHADPLLTKIQDLYVAYICNPFYNENNPDIKSETFIAKINAIVNDLEHAE